jgi:hypothetical protein
MLFVVDSGQRANRGHCPGWVSEKEVGDLRGIQPALRCLSYRSKRGMDLIPLDP